MRTTSSHDMETEGHQRCSRHRIYRLTCSQYDELEARGKGLCEVCKAAPGSYIDHDHTFDPTGVRGLVCPSCNAILRDVESGRREPSPEVIVFLDRDPIIGLLPPTKRPEGALGMSQVAPRLGVSVTYVEGLRRTGRMPDSDGQIKLGRSPWWWPETIDAWAAQK